MRASASTRFATATLAAAALACGAAAPALAHPHVWVEAHEKVLFTKDGKVEGVRNDWVFDEMYSAFVVQGVAKPGQLATTAALAPMAKTNVDSLKDFDYFTFAKADGHKVAFAPPIDYSLEERPDKRVVLHFTLPLATPVKTGRYLTLQVYDPTYFVDFELAAKDPVQLVGAPSGCSMSVLGPNPLVVEDGKTLAKAFDTGLTPSDDFALKMASRTIVACP
ncbi:MAG: DUF1007 family protein [Caulobacteraceae bacterium]|nr:DUF1007 family protein [Caulobacter sp.]